MPTSPHQHTNEEEQDRPEGSSLAGGGKAKRKRKSKPTSKSRAKKQSTKDRYAHAREDAQLEGLIPTTPEEALRPECVPSSVQGEQPLPKLTAQAIRNGWAVPEERKPKLVDELVSILDNPEMPAKVKVAAFNALRQADQSQYERDHPEEGKGANLPMVLNVNVVNVDGRTEVIDGGSGKQDD